MVGSAALGEYRPGRSDVDFLAVLDRPLASNELARLRLLHVAAGANSVFFAVVRGRSIVSGTCNGVFVTADDMATPVSEIVPVASHTAEYFEVGSGFDANPVMWRILSTKGICLRGIEPSDLKLVSDDKQLRSWNLENLEAYWRPWAEQALLAPGIDLRVRSRWWTAWGVLGVPRLYHTIATGEVISKERAGDYALSVFESEWHSIIEEGLAYRTGAPVGRSFGSAAHRIRRTAEFVLHVVDSARHQ